MNTLYNISTLREHSEREGRKKEQEQEHKWLSRAICKIFVLIPSYNHNVACMEVIGYAVQVLLNVAKSKQTIFAVYDT